MRNSRDHFHLAQANIAIGLGEPDDPVMKGFTDQLDAINAAADQAPGFVWRLQSDQGDATGLQIFDDPRMLVNMSVWESVEDLYRYAFESAHLESLQNRRAWFSKMSKPHSVLWWIPRGKLPDLSDIRKRLDLLGKEGPSPKAFTLARLFDPDGNLMTRSSEE